MAEEAAVPREEKEQKAASPAADADIAFADLRSVGILLRAADPSLTIGAQRRDSGGSPRAAGRCRVSRRYL